MTGRRGEGRAAGVPGVAGCTVDGQRHRWIESLCSMLERMWAGRAAHALLGGAGAGGPAAVVAVPMWVWLRPAVDMGRKARAGDGGTLCMPVRCDWPGGPVTLLGAGRSVQMTVRAGGLGHDLTGAVHVTCRPPAPVAAQGAGDVAVGRVDERTLARALQQGRGGLVRVQASCAGPRQVGGLLSGLARDGDAARWQAVTLLEPYARSALQHAHSYLSRDISADGSALLDETALETVFAQLLLGEPGDAGLSPVMRLLERALDPGAFARVDPLRWFSRALRRDAQQALRRRVGDPHVGSKVRRIARELGTTDVEAIVSVYRVRHPGDDVAHGRVRVAMSVGRDPMSGVRSLDLLEVS